MRLQGAASDSGASKIVSRIQDSILSCMVTNSYRSRLYIAGSCHFDAYSLEKDECSKALASLVCLLVIN